MDEPKRPRSTGTIPVMTQLRVFLDRNRIACGNPARGLILANKVQEPMNLEVLARDVIRPEFSEAQMKWHCWHAFRRGLATNLHRLGISDKVIQEILRHPNVTRTMNFYAKTASSEAAAAMKAFETMCATTVQPNAFGSSRVT